MAHQSLAHGIALVHENLDAVGHNSLNVPVAKASDSIDEFELVEAISVMIFTCLHAHCSHIQILAVLNETFLAESLERSRPILECARIHRRLELTQNIECEGGFSVSDVPDTRFKHHLLQVILREQIIAIAIILVKDILVVTKTLLSHQFFAHSAVKLLDIVEFIDIVVELDDLVQR